MINEKPRIDGALIFFTPVPATLSMPFKLEHFALNVSDPAAMAAWYVKNLGLKIVRRVEGPHHTHFLADYSGTIMIEIYNNPPGEVPPYADLNPLQLHLAFVSDDPSRDSDTLLMAGASLVEELHLPDGSHLVMMRDPWGLPIQFCKRSNPMLMNSSPD